MPTGCKTEYSTTDTAVQAAIRINSSTLGTSDPIYPQVFNYVAGGSGQTAVGIAAFTGRGTMPGGFTVTIKGNLLVPASACSNFNDGEGGGADLSGDYTIFR